MAYERAGPKPRDRAGHWKKPDEDHPRQLEALRLRRRGLTYREIGEQQGTSEATAYRDVQAVIERTKKEADETADEIRRIELERLDAAIQGLMPKVEAGNTRAAEVLVKLQERRSRFLGLDAPAKHEHSGPDGAPIEVDARNLLLERIAGLIASAATGGETGEGTQ